MRAAKLLFAVIGEGAEVLDRSFDYIARVQKPLGCTPFADARGCSGVNHIARK